MNGITLITIFVITLIAGSYGRYCGRMHNTVHPVPKIIRDSNCGCNEDIGTLVTLVRALDERECCDSSPSPNGSINNADNLIMNLVNALIQITTQALNRTNCHCTNSGGTNNNPNPGNGGNGNNPQNGGSGYSHGSGGLVNLDLLNPNKKDNVLDLDLASQHLLGVGLGGGGGNSQGSNSYPNTNGRSANGDNDEGLVNVDLLNPNKKNNIAEVDLAKQPLVGVGLGGGGTAPSHTTNTGSDTSSSKSDTGEGLINVDLLNPNKPNNVAEVDIAKQNILGVGLGIKKDDLLKDKSK